MTNRKIIVLAIIIIGLFALSAVNAADNITDNVAGTDLEINEIASSDSLKAEDTINDNNATDSQDVLAVGYDEKVSIKEDNVLSASNALDVCGTKSSQNSLSLETDAIDSEDDAAITAMDTELLKSYYPEYYEYSVSLNDYTVLYGESESIYMEISPSTSSTYSYYYYFKVYDSYGNNLITQRYSSSSSYSYNTESYYLSSTQLSPGTYTMKIENYYDDQVMDTATLTITSLPNYFPNYDNYSVSLNDYTISYGDIGTIYMNINPSTSTTYKYYYNFNVYDSDGNRKISTPYYSTSSSSSTCEYYYLSSYSLSKGIYTMKIENYVDNKVMATATLSIINEQKNSYDTTFSGLENTIDEASYYDLIKLNYDISNTDDYYSPIYISKPLTIDGNGHSIDAKGLTGIFRISSYNILLKNIKFKNADYSSGNGGAIYWSGSNGKLINCTFENNNVYGGYNGGAVYWDGSNADIKGCKFINNYAYNGSAVYLSSSGSISNCDFTSNNAVYEGGAVYSSSSATVTNSNFKNNKAKYGGAIAFGSDYDNYIEKSNFNNNIADYGSAIAWHESLGTVTDCTFNGAKTNSHRYMYVPTKFGSYFYITVNDIKLGEKLNLTIEWSSNLQESMSISIFSKRLNKTIYTSVKQLDESFNFLNILIPNLKTGHYILNVSYSGDNIYNEYEKTKEFTVNGKESNITFEAHDITWGTPIVLNPKVTAGATGLIAIYVNDIYCDNFIVGSKYSLKNVGGPTSTIRLEYLGDDNYMPSYATQTVYVERLDLSAKIPDEIDSGISTFTVTLNEDATGPVSAKVRDISCYCENSFNGTYILTSYNRIAAGSAYIEVYFEGDSKYNPKTISKYVEVKIKTPTIHLDIPNVKIGKSVSIYPTIDNGATGSFKIYVDGSYETSISTGKSHTITPQSLGKHEVKVYYSGDEYYAATENATAFRVYKINPIDAKDTQIIKNTDNYLQATFYDEYGDLLIGKLVIFNVNGTEYIKRTDENGTATLDEKFDIGVYPVEITNIDVNHRKTVYLTVFTSIISQDMTVYYNSGYDFNATFLDSDATPLSNSIVLFNVSGTTYSVQTDGYGQAKLIVPLPVGTYKIVIINAKTNEVATNKLVVVTSIISQDMSRAYNSTMDYKATFYDVDGSYLKNQTITFEVNSRTYPVKTNDHGLATLNVGLPEGEYNITSTNPATNQRSTNKLTILERIINNEDVIVYGNTATYYRVRVINNNAVVCGAGETVTFKLNGKTSTIKTDSKGYASLKIAEAGGIYDVTATYYGYTVKNKITVLENANSILTLTASNINYGQSETIKLSVNPSYLSGKVSISITGDNGYKKVFSQNAATSITKELTNLNASKYNVKVEYIDFNNLIYSSASKAFTVSKINPNIIITVDGAPYGKTSNITVNVPKAEGNVTIKVGSKTFNEHIVADGVIVKRFSDLAAGSYQVSVTYNGNNNFNKGSKTAQLNITKGSVGFYIDVKDSVYGSDINVKAGSKFNGKVTLKIGSITKTINITANKETAVNFGKLNAGKYTLTGNIVPGNKNYADESRSISFEVKKATPKLTLKAENIDLNQQTKILATISNSLTGNINLKLNGKDYVQAISDSKAVFNISNLGIGKYTITASYAGNTNFNSVSATATFEVKKIQNFNLATPTAVSTYDNKFDLGLPNDASGNVTITVNGASYIAKVANGEASIKLPQLSEGNYPFTIKYTGDSKYAGFTKTNTITVAKTTIKSRDMTVNSGSGYDYKTSIINTAGAPLANTQIHIAVNGKIFSVKTDSKGVATLNVGLGDGTYAITVINPQTGEQAKSTLTVRGGVTKTILKTSTVRTLYNSGKYISISLKDIFGKPLVSEILQVSIGGKTKYVSTDSKGIAKLTTNGLIPATHKAKITFAGNAKYAQASISSKVIVTKAPVKLIATKKIFKAGIKIKKYTVTLKNNKNKVLKKARLTLKVNGRTYKAITNNKGKATFKITKLVKKGNFKAVVKFAGNKYYKALIKKPIISIRK